MTDPASCDRVVMRAGEGLGGLDGVVFNAGIGIGYGLAGTSLADWDRVLQVNLRAPFLVGKAAMPALEAGGSRVFIGSLAGTERGKPEGVQGGVQSVVGSRCHASSTPVLSDAF